MVNDNQHIESSLIKYADMVYQQFISKRYGIQSCSGISKSNEQLFADKECAEYQIIRNQDAKNGITN